MLDVCIAFIMFLEFLYYVFIMFSLFLFEMFYCYFPKTTIIAFTSIDHLCCMNKAAVGWTRCLTACSLFRSSYIIMGNSLEQWRAGIGLFNYKCVIKQGVMIKVSLTFIFYYINYLLKRAFCSCKILSLVFNNIVCNLYFKIVLISLLLEAET